LGGVGINLLHEFFTRVPIRKMERVKVIGQVKEARGARTYAQGIPVLKEGPKELSLQGGKGGKTGAYTPKRIKAAHSWLP